jgi:hypothetical protein
VQTSNAANYYQLNNLFLQKVKNMVKIPHRITTTGFQNIDRRCAVI